jgi:hypothetical protein
MAEDANATLLETLKRLLDIPGADLKVALSLACDAVAAAVHADKVDAFLYDSARDCLVADGSSNQPLSAKQIRHGLNVLPSRTAAAASRCTKRARPSWKGT